MSQQKPIPHPVFETSELVDIVERATSPLAAPQRLLLEIHGDCENDTHQYVKETVVPHGGE